MSSGIVRSSRVALNVHRRSNAASLVDDVGRWGETVVHLLVRLIGNVRLHWSVQNDQAGRASALRCRKVQEAKIPD